MGICAIGHFAEPFQKFAGQTELFNLTTLLFKLSDDLFNIDNMDPRVCSLKGGVGVTGGLFRGLDSSLVL